MANPGTRLPPHFGGLIIAKINAFVFEDSHGRIMHFFELRRRHHIEIRQTSIQRR